MGKNRQSDPGPSAPDEGLSDLLVRFREGDPVAFQQIVGEYQARLVQFYYRLCWDRDRSEDFAQELFMKLLRGAKSYRPEGKLSTFIFRVATNLWIDHYRSTRPQPRLYSLDQPVRGTASAATAPSAETGPVDSAIADEERQRLREALECLTEPHRLVFELAVYQQMPYAEVSSVLGIPVGTVKSRMHNSVKALRQILNAAESSQERGQDRRPFRAGGSAG